MPLDTSPKTPVPPGDPMVSRVPLPCRRGALVAILLVALVGAPESLKAASLDVLAAAAQRGTNGLRVTVGSSCASPQDEVVTNQTLNGPATIEACQTVTSSSTTISSGQVTFRAGDRITLGDGFVVQSGASFVAQVDGTLLPDAHLEDRTLGAESHYAAGFFVNLNSLSVGNSDRFDLFAGESGSGVAWFSMVLKRNASLGENRIVMEARQDNGTVVSTEDVSELFLPSDWWWLAIDWKAASSGSSNGFLRLSLNNTLHSELSGLSNSNGRIGTVRLGADGVDAGTSGTFDLDHFVSRLAGPISVPP